MTESSPVLPRRNWAAVLLVIAGGYLTLTTVINGTIRAVPNFPTAIFGTESGLLFASFLLVPIAILIAFIAIGVGGRSFLPLAGRTARARLLFAGTGLFALVAQYSLIGGFVTYVAGGGSEVPEIVTTQVLMGIAAVLAIVTSVVVVRAGVARGFACWVLPLAIPLVVSSYVVANLARNDWSDIPHGLGILLLGLGWWRTGLRPSAPVPEGPESLAE